jgi:POT family proton-dependent oligopeptide transporter
MLDAVKNMPRGVNPLYLIQGFSTFSFAILYSSLALYITNQLGLSQKLAGNVVGLFLTFNYALHLIGGLLSGKFLSNRFLFLITTIVQSIGIALLAVGSTTALYLALSFFLVGCGLNTTSLNCLMTQKFSANDSRRETAFFIFYAMMNGGFFMGYISSGFFDFSNNYQPIFYVSLIINTLTAILSLIYWPQLKDKNTELEGLSSKKRLIRCDMGLMAITMLVPLMLISFQFSDLANP